MQDDCLAGLPAKHVRTHGAEVSPKRPWSWPWGLGVFACLWFGYYILLISALRGLRGPRGLWGPRGSVDPVGGLLGLAASGLALSTMLFVFACCVEGVKPLLVKIT